MATDVRCFDGGQWFSLTGPQGLRGPKGEDGLNQLTLETLCNLPVGTLFKSNGTKVAAAVVGTDFLTPSNYGLGVTSVPSDFKTIQGQSGCAFLSHGPFISLSANVVYKGRGTYITPGKAASFGLANGVFTWYTGPEWDGTGTSPDLSTIMSLVPNQPNDYNGNIVYHNVLNVYGTVSAHASDSGVAYRIPSGAAFRSFNTDNTALTYFDLGTVVFRGGNANQYSSAIEVSNIGIANKNFGGALGILSISTLLSPSSSPADTIQLYSSDLSAGNTMLSLFTEGTCVNSNATAAATHRVAVRINGTVYYLLANTAA